MNFFEKLSRISKKKIEKILFFGTTILTIPPMNFNVQNKSGQKRLAFRKCQYKISTDKF